MMLIIMIIVVELKDFKGFWAKNVKGIMWSKMLQRPREVSKKLSTNG